MLSLRLIACALALQLSLIEASRNASRALRAHARSLVENFDRSIVVLGASHSGLVALVESLLLGDASLLCLRHIGATYKSDFALTDRSSCNGDSETRVETHVLAPSDLQEISESTLAGARFVVLLADPIAQLVARYSYMLDRAKQAHTSDSVLPFKEYFVKHSAEFDVGVYTGTLETLLGRVHRERVLIINADAFTHNLSSTMVALAEHIGVASTSFAPMVASDTVGFKLSCADYKFFKCRYDFLNMGLRLLIAADQPAAQPSFDGFSDKYDTRCGAYSLAEFHSDFVGPPHVMIIGVPKGGTTSLHEFLLDTGFFVGTKKEPHFFNNFFNDAYFNDKYIGPFYEKQLSAGKFGQLTIDGSPGSFTNENVLKRMVQLYSPEQLRRKKYILTLREPVARLYSWFKHSYGECAKTIYKVQTKAQPRFITESSACNFTCGARYCDDFHSFLARNPRNGNYKKYLETWQKVVPRSQLFIISMEHMYSNQRDSIARLLQFLGIPNKKDSWVLPQKNLEIVHFSHIEFSPEDLVIRCADAAELTDYFAVENSGLVAMINSGDDRPATEPYFPEFVPFAKCVP